MQRLILFLALIASPALSYAQGIAITQFSGLNTSADPVAIDPSQSQDLLNVERNKLGMGMRKRDGYSTQVQISTVTSGLKSIFGFKNTSGNDIIIAVDGDGNIKKSVNGASAVQISTLTAGVRLYCQANSGIAYCYPSSSTNDRPFTYDGTTLSSKTTDSYPAGTVNAFTLDRQVAAGVSGSPNTVYISKSGDFDEFDTGNELVDPWTEDVGSSGDKIVGVYYLGGRVIVAKEYSIHGLIIQDQFSSEGYQITGQVGLVSPESMVLKDGKGFFLGSDNNFYSLTGVPGEIEKLSVQISSTTSQFLSGKNRYDIQTDLSHWVAGTEDVAGPQSKVSSARSPGSIEPSTWSHIDTSTQDWTDGTLVRVTTHSSIGSIQIASRTFVDGFTDTSNWTAVAGGGALYVTEYGWSNGNVMYAINETIARNSTLPISSGSWSFSHAYVRADGASGCHYGTGTCLDFRFNRNSSGDFYSARIYLLDSVHSAKIVKSVSSAETVLSSYDMGDYSTYAASEEHDFQITRSSIGTGAMYLYFEGVMVASAADTSISGASTLDVLINYPQGSGANGFNFIDNVNVFQMYSSATWTSPIFDTAFSTPIWGDFSADLSSSSVMPIKFYVSASTDSDDTFDAFAIVSNTGTPTNKAGRYVKYKAEFETEIASNTPSLHVAALAAATTGIYESQCISIGSGISAWGTIESAGLNLCGSVAYQASTGTSCSSMSPYSAISTGTTLTHNAGAALKYKLTFSLESGSCTARVDSLTTNWLEGSAPPPSPSTYWNDAIYWGVCNSGSANNRMMKLDLLSGDWFLFDVPAMSMFSWANNMYFGGISSAKIFKFSDIKASLAPTSDDGAAINAYWKSKNFSDADPFVESTLDRISAILKKQDGGSVTASWEINGGDTASGSYDISLSTGPNVVRSNYFMPFGQRGTFWNYKISNNSIFPFEILGLKFDSTPRQWRVMP